MGSDRHRDDEIARHAAQGRRERGFHGGAPGRLDDDALAERAEDERVDAGLDDYDPDEVPPATDTPPDNVDVTTSQQYQEELEAVRTYERRHGGVDEPPRT
jgi:hypothetical protein